MDYKRFIPCIYLYRTHAVRTLKDLSIVDTDPVRLASHYSDNNADELLIFDMSEDDAQHEEALDLIKEICNTIAIPVIGAGHIHRMEDVKKLLYAGCKRAVLDFENPENVAITQEVSLKFGKDKLLASFSEPELLTDEQKGLIEEYTTEILLMNTHKIRETQAALTLPTIVQINQVALNKLMDIFACENIWGVTGNVVNDNAEECLNLKKLCRENNIPVGLMEAKFKWEDLKKNSDGQVPVVVQEDKTGEVLMVAYMNEEAYQKTLLTGKMTYYSRSRQELWVKGDTSGHYQYVKSLTADCDLDTILAKVTQIGAACHTGNHSCFFQEIVSKEEKQDTNPLKVFEEVSAVIHDRKINPKEGSYTNYLFDKGIDKILKKLGEEATEIVIAAKNPNPNEIKYEISDFLYHMMVLMEEKGVTWEEITEELAKR